MYMCIYVYTGQRGGRRGSNPNNLLNSNNPRSANNTIQAKIPIPNNHPDDLSDPSSAGHSNHMANQRREHEQKLEVWYITAIHVVIWAIFG